MKSTNTEITWHSWYIYYRSTANTLLAGQVWPLVHEAMQKGWVEHFFFIRYYDRHGIHMRLRLKGRQDLLAAKVAPVMQKMFADIRPVSYRPELGRYGGRAGVAIAEQLFEASSQAVLSFLRETPEPNYEKSLGAALQLNIATAHTLGIVKDEATAFFDHIAANRDPTAMAKHFNRQKAVLVPTVTQMWTRLDAQVPFGVSWLDSYVEEVTRVGRSLQRAYDSNDLRPDPKRTHREHPMWALYESYVHMNNNRLGLTIEDEGYLAYTLSRSLGQYGR